MVKFAITTTTTKKSKWKNTMDYIILHHTWDELSLENEVNYLAKNKAQVSVHYVVARDWEIGKIWEDTDILWHTWNWNYRWKIEDFNPYSIWIEIISKWFEFTDRQRKSVRELVSYLLRKYNIPYNRIVTHKMLSGYRGKWDVWDAFRNHEYKTFEEYTLSFNKNNMLELDYIPIRDAEAKEKGYESLFTGDQDANLKALLDITYFRIMDKIKEWQIKPEDIYNELSNRIKWN